MVLHTRKILDANLAGNEFREERVAHDSERSGFALVYCYALP
jgi:hypothetical protein